ncbi:MAG: MarR family transcriptional regulator, partial [bacterium]|nr:MarR family transcriptional regulator [bacterium]
MTADPFSTDLNASFGARDERRGLLIMADDAAVGDADALAQAAGLRLLGIVPLETAPTRLDIQVGCDIVLLFCPHPSSLLERLIVQIETVAIQNNMAVILVAGLDTIDLAFACLRSPRTQLLCSPDDTDMAAALLAAAASESVTHNLHDVGRESEGVRLQQLSEEVSRLARTIEALTDRPRSAMPSFELGPRIADRPSAYIG